MFLVLYCPCFVFLLQFPFTLYLSLDISSSLSPSLFVSMSLSLFLPLSLCDPLSFPPATPISEQKCHPLFLYPALSLTLLFLIGWQYIQGFCSLVFLTVSLLQDKTENKSIKNTHSVPKKISPACDEKTKLESRKRLCHSFFCPVPHQLPFTFHKHSDDSCKHTINTLLGVERFGLYV